MLKTIGMAMGISMVISCSNTNSPPAPTADFELQVSPQNPSVRRKQSTTIQVTLKPLNNFQKTVTLNVKDLLTGVTVNPQPIPALQPNQTVELTLNTTDQFLEGYTSDITLQVTGTSGDLIRQTAVKLRITPGSGDLLRNFGDDGTAQIDPSGEKLNAYPQELIRQPDGKLVVVGYAGDTINSASHGYVTLSRFLGNGTPDLAFGDGGTQKTGPFSEAHLDVRGVRLDNGRFLVATVVWDGIRLYRFLENGKPDMTFGNQGQVLVSVESPSRLKGMKLQTDGKILLAGTSYGRPIDQGGTDYDFFLARVHPSGQFDTQFDSDGIVFTDFQKQYDSLAAMALQNDGKIVLVGDSSDGVGRLDLHVVRYTTNGQLDTTFGKQGDFTLPTGVGTFVPWSITSQQDRKVLVGANGNNEGLLFRLTHDGKLDASFDEDGLLRDTTGKFSGQVNQILEQEDSKIVMLGRGSNSGPAVVNRFHADGSLDLTFGKGGSKTDHDAGNFFAGVLEADRIVVAGNIWMHQPSHDEMLLKAFAR